MKFVHFFKPGLFIYECLRLILLVSILFSQEDPGGAIKVIYAVPAVLFPLMALFIWLDTSRYEVYLPLFTAGKCLGIFVLLGWSIVSKQVTIMESFILSGDLFALAVILLIMKDVQKPIETQELMEEK